MRFSLAGTALVVLFASSFQVSARLYRVMKPKSS
jgi:hypothetical protein